MNNYIKQSNKSLLWGKIAIVFIVLCWSIIYALPNIYPIIPAVNIVNKENSLIDKQNQNKIIELLENKNIELEIIEKSESGKTLTLGFLDYKDQLTGKALLDKSLQGDFLVSLSRYSSAPKFLAKIGSKPLNLGLDLQGGVHFLLEVDIEKSIQNSLKSIQSETKNLLRDDKIRYLLVELENNDSEIHATFRSENDRDTALKLLKKELPDTGWLISVNTARPQIVGILSEERIINIKNYAVNQNLISLRNRVNELGISEPVVQKQGANRIIVQLPGIQDTAQAKRIIGSTANLEFRLQALETESSFEKERFYFRDSPGQSAMLEKNIIISGSNIVDAYPGTKRNGQPQVSIKLNKNGGRRMTKYTREAVSRMLGTVFVETKTKTEYITDDKGDIQTVHTPFSTSYIISLANINQVLGSDFRITGLDSYEEASELSLLLRAGALASPMYFVEERSIGPSLGKENIQKGVYAVILGFILVLLFMLFYYRIFGFIANIALLFNLLIIISVVSMLGATLTLPGIAGIVLIIGMAIDANVLIFSRIKEECLAGSTIGQAIEQGFSRAIASILDANITTLLVALVLFGIGSGPVKGFAVTLSIGILASMFTAIIVTKIIINITYNSKHDKIWQVWKV